MKIPISAAVQVGDIIYIGGTPPLDNARQLIGENNIALQTQTVINRITALLAAAQMTLSDLVFVTVYLIDLVHFEEVNVVYAEMLTAPYPARKVVQTPLTTEGAMVEMTAVAIRGAKTILNSDHSMEVRKSDY